MVLQMIVFFWLFSIVIVPRFSPASDVRRIETLPPDLQILERESDNAFGDMPENLIIDDGNDDSLLNLNDPMTILSHTSWSITIPYNTLSQICHSV
jgi:hypothetical protein